VNVVMMLGTLSRDPEARSLPSGDLLLSFDLTTKRGDDPAQSAPVVWFEPPETGAALEAGDAVLVVGRVRRRWFRAGGTTQSRTEVVAERVVPARHTKRCRAAVDHALVQIADGVSEAGVT
jgi:single-strand DNA-binding protein